MSGDEEEKGPLALRTWGMRLGEEESSCPYLEGRTSRTEAWVTGYLPPPEHQGLMDRGWRRAGAIVYRNLCSGCQACIPLRIRASEFRPSRSQRRALRRNLDLRVELGTPELTDEKIALYRRYLEGQHRDTDMSSDPESLERFLYDSPTSTVEICYRDGHGELLGVGILDEGPDFFSSVYFYFDPAQGRRSLGVASVLHEIALCREAGRTWYYLGFWVPGSRTMDYKAGYGPHEVLGPDGWERRERRLPGDGSFGF